MFGVAWRGEEAKRQGGRRRESTDFAQDARTNEHCEMSALNGDRSFSVTRIRNKPSRRGTVRKFTLNVHHNDARTWDQLVNKSLSGVEYHADSRTRKDHGLKVEDLSRDPEIGRVYMKDPLVHIRITARLFKICHENASYILENADRINTKMLLIHGTADGITSHKGSEELAQKTGADLKLWEDFRHETHNEFGLEEVLDFQYKWIMKNLDII